MDCLIWGWSGIFRSSYSFDGVQRAWDSAEVPSSNWHRSSWFSGHCFKTERGNTFCFFLAFNIEVLILIEWLNFRDLCLISSACISDCRLKLSPKFTGETPERDYSKPLKIWSWTLWLWEAEDLVPSKGMKFHFIVSLQFIFFHRE